MGDFGITAITLAAAAASAGTAASGALSKNKAVKNSQNSARTAAIAQRGQIEDAAALERLKRKRESDRIRGRLAVVGAASGVDPTGSYADLERQVGFDEDLNLDIIETNRRNQTARVESGLTADLAAIGAQRRNVLLDAFSGGAQGVQTGLSLYNALPDQEDVDKWLIENGLSSGGSAQTP